MNIAVINAAGRTLATYRISLAGLNYTPTEREYFDQAKQNAIEEGYVTEQEAETLTFRIVD